ncbi:Coatomer subunit delta [Histomonas meleagridis]|uniref:Coatomer subunit delta n=1 Tax=Histomonas meleagridis TaxID=135588 RepID=UPI00355997EF|nr:Coatomer subunit delta [Histomonas meleagridis]KAH0798054.1 Coatomer subunit delta [Histomonas meleagridis]
MIHAVALISHAGKLILARQFTHENRSQIEGELAAFPKLAQASKHSYIDTEDIRFVFQDMGETYLVVIASKDSNIVETLEALSLLVDVTRTIATDFTEEKIISHGLDLIFAYDECVIDGFKQSFTPSDIIRFLKMDSAEEREFIRQREEKEARAAEELKRKMLELEEQKSGKQFTSSSTTSTYSQPTVLVDAPPPSTPKPEAPRHHHGMVLSRRDTKSRAQQVLAEEGIKAPDLTPQEKTAESSSPGFRILIQERITAFITRLGSVHEFAVEGRLITSCSSSASALIHIGGDLRTDKYRYKPMQQPRGTLWSEDRKLIYDNNTGKYKPGSDVSLLCWRMISTDINDIPIGVSCWVPQTTQTSTTFSIEVELKDTTFKTDNIEVIIPLANPRGVNVSMCDGSTEVFERDQYLKWTLDQLDKDNTTAEIEMNVPPCEEDSFFPVSVSFVASSTMSKIVVESVEPSDADAEELPEVTIVSNCFTNKFEIQ